jgi:hypothetical protein
MPRFLAGAFPQLGDMRTYLTKEFQKIALAFQSPEFDDAIGASLEVTGELTSSGGAMGYATGAGGTVTQLTSQNTDVTLNKLCGDITMFSAVLVGSPDSSAFVLNNSFIEAGDTVIVSIQNIPTLSVFYWVWATTVSAGTCTIYIENQIGPTANEAPVIRFCIIKASTS